MSATLRISMSMAGSQKLGRKKPQRCPVGVAQVIAGRLPEANRAVADAAGGWRRLSWEGQNCKSECRGGPVAVRSRPPGLPLHGGGRAFRCAHYGWAGKRQGRGAGVLT